MFFAPVALLVRTQAGVSESEFFLLQALLSCITALGEVPFGHITDKIGYKKYRCRYRRRGNESRKLNADGVRICGDFFRIGIGNPKYIAETVYSRGTGDYRWIGGVNKNLPRKLWLGSSFCADCVFGSVGNGAGRVSGIRSGAVSFALF